MRHFIKERLGFYCWSIYGTTVRNPKMSAAPKSFLFVCKGNICRSPFAEHMARNIAGSRRLGTMLFCSGGLEVSTSSPPPEEALRAAREFGVHHGTHRSRAVTYDMVKASDMTLAMELRHFLALRNCFPEFTGKIFLLPLFEEDSAPWHRGYRRYTIPDPYDKPSEQFLACFRRIAGCLDKLFSEVARRAGP